MNRQTVRILYATSPETVGRLSKRLMPAAASMEIRESNNAMYLAVTLKDDFSSIIFEESDWLREEQACGTEEDRKVRYAGNTGHNTASHNAT